LQVEIQGHECPSSLHCAPMGLKAQFLYKLVEWEAVEREEAADGVFADAVGDIPGRVLIKELEAGFGTGGEARVGLDAVLELGLEGGVFVEVFAGEFLEDVGFAVFALLKDGVKESPAQGGVGGLGLKPLNGDLGEALIERDDDRAGGEGDGLLGECADAEAAWLCAGPFAVKDGMAAFEGRALPLHTRAAVALDVAGPRSGSAAEGEAVGFKDVDHVGPLAGDDVGGGGRGGERDLCAGSEGQRDVPGLVRVADPHGSRDGAELTGELIAVEEDGRGVA
jgi:hypothetical protein